MHKIAYSIIKDQHLAEDIVHISMIKIINKLLNHHNMENYKNKSYIIEIVKNTSIDMIRKLRKEKNISYEDNLSYLDKNYYWDLEFYLDDEFDRMVLSLHPKYREVILLKYYHDLPNKDIGDLLDISEENTRQRLSRARKRLKKLIENQMEIKLEEV